MIYGLFLLVCSSINCQYIPYGHAYQDEKNCIADMEMQSPGIFECLPIEAIIHTQN